MTRLSALSVIALLALISASACVSRTQRVSPFDASSASEYTVVVSNFNPDARMVRLTCDGFLLGKVQGLVRGITTTKRVRTRRLCRDLTFDVFSIGRRLLYSVPHPTMIDAGDRVLITLEYDLDLSTIRRR